MPDDLIERRKFPILGGNGAKVDWQLVADHGRQAKANHYQTVERLAERGGLSWSELHAVLHNRPWQKMDDNTAIIECRALEARYLNADALAARDAEIARLKALLDEAGEVLKRIFTEETVDIVALLDDASAFLAKLGGRNAD